MVWNINNIINKKSVITKYIKLNLRLNIINIGKSLIILGLL